MRIKTNIKHKRSTTVGIESEMSRVIYLVLRSSRLASPRSAPSIENKGIAVKARMACTTRYKHGRDHYLSGMTRAKPKSFQVKMMVILCLYQAVQPRQALKAIPLLSFLNTSSKISKD